DPSFEVQVRQCPWSPGARVTTVRAVGVRIGNDRVEYQSNGSVYVNGALTPVNSVVALPDGGSVYTATAGGYVFAWPAGDRLIVRSFGSYMNVYLITPKVRFGQMLGLFGNADGDPTNDFMLARDGSDLRDYLTFSEMYRDPLS